jgi:hypothetical protein
MRSPDHDQSPRTPEARLRAAKEAFSKAVLEDDILFAAIQEQSARLAGQDPYRQLEDFSVEPWRPNSEVEGRQQVGLRITQSASFGDEESGIAVGMGMYGYVPVVDLDVKGGEALASDEVRSQGSPEQVRAAMYHFWATYIKFLTEVGYGDQGQASTQVAIDPHSGTFDTIDRLERRFYQ